MTDGEYDIVVIGAGPAGMAASVEARKAGASVLLLDEQDAVGGQIYRNVERASSSMRDVLGHEYRYGGGLAKTFAASGASYGKRSTVIDISRDGWVGYEHEGNVSYVKAGHIIIATGAAERPFPIPGWTLPGTMTVGAAQTMLKSSAAVPSPRAVLAGTGPLLYLFAAQVLRAGRKLGAIVDTSPRIPRLSAMRQLPGALRAPRYLMKGFGLLSAIRKANVPHYWGAIDLRIDGLDKTESISFSVGGRQHRIETDLVLLHQGVIPNIQITQALRCDHRWDELQMCWAPKLDIWGRTSLERIFVAGDGAGIGGALAAEYRGRIAALGVLADTGKLAKDEASRIAGRMRQALNKELAIRPFLDQLYQPPPSPSGPKDQSTIICRCEEVTVGQIGEAVAIGCAGPNQLKAFLRAGMGPCQGRMCGLSVSQTISEMRDVPVTEVGIYRLRPPFKPVSLLTLSKMSIPDRQKQERRQ
ncbi:NAD(P)/FAD-dependent oxidoreductase [Natronohydrobacter thiooxidans]|uniref:NAD(P)/FAD-dependent oxidoreductase n=1 Tax=Natronohydrobacter thiooxidans TaxID=87172 RepID=UPI0008FF59AF|nr:FAD/NAD(P)-binding oxidoreductase [Natronohydrobacter thiooxidans]